jgi:hypothetical protein
VNSKQYYAFLPRRSLGTPSTLQERIKFTMEKSNELNRPIETFMTSTVNSRNYCHRYDAINHRQKPTINRPPPNRY